MADSKRNTNYFSHLHLYAAETWNVEFGLAVPHNACPHVSGLGAALTFFAFPGVALFLSRLTRKPSDHLVFTIAFPVFHRPILTIYFSPFSCTLRSVTPVKVVVYTSLTTLAFVSLLIRLPLIPSCVDLSVFSRFLACHTRALYRFVLGQFYFSLGSCYLCAATLY